MTRHRLCGRWSGWGALVATTLSITGAAAQQPPAPGLSGPSGALPADATLVAARIQPSVDGPRQLVLTPWRGEAWSFQQYNELVEVRLVGTALALDLGAIAGQKFDGALRDLTWGTQGRDTMLRLVLGCDCKVTLQAAASDRLVLDIVDNRTEVALADGATGETEAPGPAAPKAAPPPPRPANRPVLAAGTAPAQAAGTVPSLVAPATPTVPGPLNAEDVRARLIAQLQQAARDGLITLKDPPPTAPAPEAEPAAPELALAAAAPTAASPADSPAGPPPPTPPAAAGEAPAAAPPPALAAVPSAAEPPAAPAVAAKPEPAAKLAEPTPAPHPQVAEADGEAEQPATPAQKQSVITPRSHKGHPTPAAAPEATAAEAVPAAAESARAAVDLLGPVAKPVCLDDAVLRLPDPLSPAETATALSVLNSKLYGEFDRIDPAPAEEMARIYLAQGLGVEAIAAMQDFAPQLSSAPALAVLGQLLEGGALMPGHALSAPDCPGVQAIWQAYAAVQAGDAAGALAAEGRAGRSIELLPRALRTRLAAAIGGAALDIGDLATARRLQALATRAAPRDADNLELALFDARLRRAEGAPDEALALLRPLRVRGGEIGAEATLLIADMVLQNELPNAVGSRQLRTDLGAIAFDQLGDPQGRRAFAAEADLTAKADGREAALDLLAFGLARGLTDQTGYVGAVRRIGAGTGAADETPLAVLYDANPSRFRAALEEPSFRIALAKSYADIGAPDLGRDLLRPDDLTQPDVAQALAQAWLSAGEVDKAEAAVQPLEPGPVRASVEEAVANARGAASALIALNQDRAGDVGTAEAWGGRLSALEEQLATTPDAGAATRATLLSASLGQSQPPPEAAKTLQGTDPALAARLQGLFKPADPQAASQSSANVPEYLKSVTDEAQLYKDLLKDG